MAITDDDFSPLELEMLYGFAEERGIPSEELDKILLSADNQFVVPESVEKKVEYLYDLACMIWADKKVTVDERNTLMKYCRTFGFVEENIEELAQYLLDSVENGISKQKIIEELNS